MRNIKAFQVLQTVWLRSNSQLITSTILDVILSLYQQDPANYFILLPQQTIKTVCHGGLARGSKPSSNIGRFFRIVEWVGLNLGYMLVDELKWIHSQLEEPDVTNEYIKATFKCIEKLLRAKRAYKDVIIQSAFVESSTRLLNRSPELDRLICTTVRLIVAGSEAGCRAFEGTDCVIRLISAHNDNDFAFSLLHTLMTNNPSVEIKRVIRLLDDVKLPIGMATELTRQLIDIIPNSAAARDAFRTNGGANLLVTVFSTFKKAISPEQSNVKSGLPGADIISHIEATINLLATCVASCPAMMADFESSGLGLDELYQLFLQFGCFYESERLEECEPCQIEINLRLEVAKIAESTSPLSVRRLMLIMAPLIRCSIDKNNKIIIPAFIHLIVKLIPHVLIIDRAQRAATQITLINLVNEMLRDSDNLETMSLCVSTGQKLIDLMMSGVYMQQQRAQPDTSLRRAIQGVFDKLVLVSVPIELFREYVRFDNPLGSLGMAHEGGPISERAYKSVLKILKRARRPNYQRPGAIFFNTLMEHSAPSSLAIDAFLQPQVESTLRHVG